MSKQRQYPTWSIKATLGLTDWTGWVRAPSAPSAVWSAALKAAAAMEAEGIFDITVSCPEQGTWQATTTVEMKMVGGPVRVEEAGGAIDPDTTMYHNLRQLSVSMSARATRARRKRDAGEVDDIIGRDITDMGSVRDQMETVRLACHDWLAETELGPEIMVVISRATGQGLEGKTETLTIEVKSVFVGSHRVDLVFPFGPETLTEALEEISATPSTGGRVMSGLPTGFVRAAHVLEAMAEGVTVQDWTREGTKWCLDEDGYLCATMKSGSEVRWVRALSSTLPNALGMLSEIPDSSYICVMAELALKLRGDKRAREREQLQADRRARAVDLGDDYAHPERICLEVCWPDHVCGRPPRGE